MKNGLIFLLALAALFACIGCPPPASDCTVRFGLDESFTLDQSVTACTKDGADFKIRFDSVTGDSRCPIGVQCIWAGRADLSMTLKSGGVTQTVALASGDMSQGGKGEAVFNGYTVKLEGVEPPKEEGRNLQQKDYKAKLRVTK